METTQDRRTINMEHVIHFIQCYRAFQKKPLKVAFEIIKYLFQGTHLTNHLCNHWRGKEKDFASFFLNLDISAQLKFSRYFGIKYPEDEKYLQEKQEIEKSDQPHKIIFLKRPPFLNTINTIILFFNNHGISEHPTGYKDDMILEDLPKEGKRYGNGANWGDYLLYLSYDQQKNLITSIIAFANKKLN